jgi:tRNA threonylcarbamoyladenosine biosynthesis protein TsaB
LDVHGKIGAKVCDWENWSSYGASGNGQCRIARLRGVGATRFVAGEKKMPSLHDLLAAHAPLLVLDAASSRIQIGLFAADGSVRWESSEAEAGVGLFLCVEALALDLLSVAAFAFSEGPGSVLGIRTTAMALRAWTTLEVRPIFAYSSLAVIWHALRRDDTAVISDARRDRWHRYRAPEGLTRVHAGELSGPLATPEGFRNWSTLPAKVERVPYRLADLLPSTARVDLFRPVDAPDAFLHEEPSYVTWTPQIHRAPQPTP